MTPLPRSSAPLNTINPTAPLIGAVDHGPAHALLDLHRTLSGLSQQQQQQQQAVVGRQAGQTSSRLKPQQQAKRQSLEHQPTFRSLRALAYNISSEPLGLYGKSITEFVSPGIPPLVRDGPPWALTGGQDAMKPPARRSTAPIASSNGPFTPLTLAPRVNTFPTLAPWYGATQPADTPSGALSRRHNLPLLPPRIPTPPLADLEPNTAWEILKNQNKINEQSFPPNRCVICGLENVAKSRIARPLLPKLVRDLGVICKGCWERVGAKTQDTSLSRGKRRLTLPENIQELANIFETVFQAKVRALLSRVITPGKMPNNFSNLEKQYWEQARPRGCFSLPDFLLDRFKVLGCPEPNAIQYKFT